MMTVASATHVWLDGLIEQRGIHIFCLRDKQVCAKGPSQDIKKKEKYRKQVWCFSRVHFCLRQFLAAVLLFTILTSGTLGIRCDRWTHWISQPVISFWLLRQTASSKMQWHISSVKPLPEKKRTDSSVQYQCARQQRLASHAWHKKYK